MNLFYFQLRPNIGIIYRNYWCKEMFQRNDTIKKDSRTGKGGRGRQTILADFIEEISNNNLTSKNMLHSFIQNI